jgi:hypothetical protein
MGLMDGLNLFWRYIPILLMGCSFINQMLTALSRHIFQAFDVYDIVRLKRVMQIDHDPYQLAGICVQAGPRESALYRPVLLGHMSLGAIAGIATLSANCQSRLPELLARIDNG